MIEMVRHSLKKHKYKIAFGIPMVFLLASSLSLIRKPEEISIIPEDNRFVAVNETVTLHIVASADSPINVVSGAIKIPQEMITVDSIIKSDSIINLWTEEPKVDENGILHFSGGIINKTGFIGTDNILTLVIHPTQEGRATISFDDAHMLAHDGTGMEIDCNNKPITLSIRSESSPSPDVNGDTRVSIADFGIISARIFMDYERPYDLNLDGIITFSDLAILISEAADSSKLGSLAISWIK